MSSDVILHLAVTRLFSGSPRNPQIVPDSSARQSVTWA